MKRAIPIKWMIFTIIVAVVVFVFAIGYQYNMQHQDAAHSKVQQVRTLSLVESFDSIEELRERAEIIAHVSIQYTEPFTAAYVPFTVSEAEIIELYKGDTTKKTINILETGGLDMTGEEVVYDGNPVMKKRDEAIVFLRRYVGPLAEDAYVILGVYQGKFLVDKNRVIPPNGVSTALENITDKKELLSLLH